MFPNWEHCVSDVENSSGYIMYYWFPTRHFPNVDKFIPPGYLSVSDVFSWIAIYIAFCRVTVNLLSLIGYNWQVLTPSPFFSYILSNKIFILSNYVSKRFLFVGCMCMWSYYINNRKWTPHPGAFFSGPWLQCANTPRVPPTPALSRCRRACVSTSSLVPHSRRSCSLVCPFITLDIRYC